jgi:hypothetical protein
MPYIGKSIQHPHPIRQLIFASQVLNSRRSTLRRLLITRDYSSKSDDRWRNSSEQWMPSKDDYRERGREKQSVGIEQELNEESFQSSQLHRSKWDSSSRDNLAPLVASGDGFKLKEAKAKTRKRPNHENLHISSGTYNSKWDDDWQNPFELVASGSDDAAQKKENRNTPGEPGATFPGTRHFVPDNVSPYGWRRLRLSTRERLKRAAPDPSVYLIAALSASGNHAVLPQPSPSHGGSRTLTNQKRSYQFGVKHSKLCSARHLLDEPMPKTINPKILNFQWITAKFIQWEHETGRHQSTSIPINGLETESGSFGTPLISHGMEVPGSAEASGPALSVEELAFLSERNFTPHDARFWAILLAQTDTLIASRALLAKRITVDGKTFQTDKPVPHFVLNFILRRRHISAPALESLLTHAWDTLSIRLHAALRDHDQRPRVHVHLIYDQLAFVLFVRFCRHARMVWPAALTNISAIVTTHILHVSHLSLLSGKVELSETQLARLTALCNRALKLLSYPTKLNPLRSALHQQRAQFDLIRQMVQHQPPLPVTRLGHQSLTDVLLRLKKTPQERDWANLKAKSWPPFKQSKTRLDDDKDPEYGISHAGQSIRFMQAYGYPLEEQDVIANTLAGWHPDGSPTIQTRAITSAMKEKNPDLRNQPASWTSAGVISALIHSTRTMEEAWSCFLMYEQSPLPPHISVYTAMFKKIIYDHTRVQDINMENQDYQVRPKSRTAGRLAPLPGDGLETVEASEDPAEAVYIPIPVPSLEELYNRMLQDGLKPDDQLLDLLVSKAFTLESGIRVWNSQWASNTIDQPISDSSSALDSTQMSVRQNETLPEKFPPVTERRLTKLIELLCRFSDFPFEGLPRLTKSAIIIAGWQFRDRHPLVYALLLLMHYKPSYRPAWTAVLQALTQKRMIVNATRFVVHDRQHLPRLLAMILAQEVVRTMDEAGIDLDSEGFVQVCICAQNAAYAAIDIREQLDGSSMAFNEERYDEKYRDKTLKVRNQAIHEAGFQLWDCPRRLRAMFAKLVGLGKKSAPSDSHIPDSVAPIPRFYACPSPAQLHHYVRALGFYGDHEGLLSLVKWMVMAKEDVDIHLESELNGMFKLRTLLTSLRVFLECPQLEFRAARRGVKMVQASAELIALVKEEVESVGEWGGWPTDDEVEIYCRE